MPFSIVHVQLAEIELGTQRRSTLGKTGGVVLTFSGSVEFVKYAKWATLAKSPGKNQFWCNPGTNSGHQD